MPKSKTRQPKKASPTKRTESGGGEHRSYDLTVVVSPTVKAEKRRDVLGEIEKLMKKNGSVTGVEEIGLRDLAYPLKKFLSGWYATIHAELMPESVAGLERELDRTDALLRHLILRT